MSYVLKNQRKYFKKTTKTAEFMYDLIVDKDWFKVAVIYIQFDINKDIKIKLFSSNTREMYTLEDFVLTFNTIDLNKLNDVISKKILRIKNTAFKFLATL